MICQIKYYDEKVKGYAGKNYTYLTGLDLKPLDKVLAPVYDGSKSKAIVVEINLSEGVIDPVWRDALKTIEEYDLNG